MAELTAKAQSLKTSFAAQLFGDRLATLPEPIRDDTRQALAAEAGKRTEVQKYLASRFTNYLRPPEKGLSALLSATYADYKARAAGIAGTIAAEHAAKRAFPEIRAFYDLPGDVKTPILKRGEYTQPGPRGVRPGVIRALATPISIRTVTLPPGKDSATVRPPPGIRPMANSARPPTDGAGHGQPNLAAPLW